MVLKKEVLSDIKKHFRLNIYEVKIWTALLSKGVSSAGELADISGVPRSRCYDVLESLEKKGFVIMKVGKPIEYMALSPEVILERVKQGIKQHADTVVEHMQSVRETDEFRELELLYKSGVQHIDISSLSRSIVGATGVNRKIKEMIGSAKSSVTIVTNSRGLERMAKLVKNSLESLAKRSVKVRICAPYDKMILKKLNGVQFTDYHTDTQFISVDDNQLLFMITPDSVVADYEVGVWIESRFFVSAVNMLFEAGIK